MFLTFLLLGEDRCFGCCCQSLSFLLLLVVPESNSKFLCDCLPLFPLLVPFPFLFSSLDTNFSASRMTFVIGDNAAVGECSFPDDFIFRVLVSKYRFLLFDPCLALLFLPLLLDTTVVHSDSDFESSSASLLFCLSGELDKNSFACSNNSFEGSVLLPSELAFGVAMFPLPRAPLMRAPVAFALFLSFFLSFSPSFVAHLAFLGLCALFIHACDDLNCHHNVSSFFFFQK